MCGAHGLKKEKEGNAAGKQANRKENRKKS